MEYDTFYFMHHPPYLTYEYMLRDEECWDDSIKQKYNQQPFSIVKEEQQLMIKDEENEPLVKEEAQPSFSGRFQSNPTNVVIQHKDTFFNYVAGRDIFNFQNFDFWT